MHKLKLVIFALFFMNSAQVFCMEEEREAVLEVTLEQLSEGVLLKIFAWLLPSENIYIPFVCSAWLELSQDPRFAQNSYQLFKSLSQDRVAKGSCYLMQESFRLEKALPDLVSRLLKSPYFFNLGNKAREKAERILCSQFDKKPLCLIRNSRQSHMIALSFITDKKYPEDPQDISASDNSININAWLPKEPNITIIEKSQDTLYKMTDDEDNKEISVCHSAVMLAEEPASKKIMLIFKSTPDIVFSSLELLIEHLRKVYILLKYNSLNI